MPDDVRPIVSADLYEADYVAWAEAQAAALEAGRLDELDLVNLADEVGGLGKSEQNSCRSFVGRIIEHLLKLQFVRSPQDIGRWRGEIATFRIQLQRRLTPTLRERLPTETREAFEEELRILRRRDLIQDDGAVRAMLGDGYTWDQITDPDFFPEPRD